MGCPIDNDSRKNSTRPSVVVLRMACIVGCSHTHVCVGVNVPLYNKYKDKTPNFVCFRGKKSDFREKKNRIFNNKIGFSKQIRIFNTNSGFLFLGNVS